MTWGITMPNIHEMQRRLSQWATDHERERYCDLFNLVCDREWLYRAYKNVAENKGSQTPGVDGASHRDWGRNLNIRIEELRTALLTGTYCPQPSRRVYIPKKGGKLRPLGIPTFRDKIVQEAIRMVIEPIFEADFLPYSFGFRPKRSTHDAMAAVRTHMMDGRRMYYVIEGDIKGCFDAIHHKKLMCLLRKRIADKRVLNIILLFLKAGIMENGLFKVTEQGTPQGGVISPLLANIYLHEFDRYFHDQFKAITSYERDKRRRNGENNASYVRYADDFVIHCNGHIKDVRQLKEDVAEFLVKELHLTLSTEKTLITHVDDGFEFLGFRFYRGLDRERKWKPKTTIPPIKVQAVKEKIKALTERDHLNMSEAGLISQLNAILRGWGNYYRNVPASKTFNMIDHYVFGRVVRWYCQKYHWSPKQVLVRKYTCNQGNKRLFAEWKSQGEHKHVQLFMLSRDIKFREYFHRKITNPYLADI